MVTVPSISQCLILCLHWTNNINAKLSIFAKLSPSFSSAGLSLALMLISPNHPPIHPSATRESTETYQIWKFKLDIHTKHM